MNTNSQRRWAMMLVALVSVLFAWPESAWSAVGPKENTQGALIWIPREGTLNGMLTRVCGTDLRTPAPLVVVNHGSPPRASDREFRQPSSCGEVARFFTSRGYTVAFPLRPGYGETGGRWTDGYGTCDSADFVAGGLATADDIAVAVDFLLRQPYVARTGTIVIGQSAGGWGTLAYASRNPSGIATFINFAGARGAKVNPDGSYGHCSPGALVKAAAVFGRSTRQPSLWVYSENDLLVPKDLSGQLQRAYLGAGGPASYMLLGPYSNNGHNLFFGKGGSAIWGPVVDRWLAQYGRH